MLHYTVMQLFVKPFTLQKHQIPVYTEHMDGLFIQTTRSLPVCDQKELQEELVASLHLLHLQRDPTPPRADYAGEGETINQ